METEKFKGDETELKFELSASPAFDLTSSTLDDFFAGGYDAAPFLLAMYDDKRFPFSERISRDSFLGFLAQTLNNFPFTGTFDVYLAVLTSLFGSSSEIRFEVPAPGKLSISVDGIENSEFQFIGREFSGDAFESFEITDDDGNILVFRGLSGIETQYQLELLFSELIPAGIYPSISLGFFDISDFAWDDADDSDVVTDTLDNGIIFIEGI